MADDKDLLRRKISQLNETSEIYGDEVTPIVQSGRTWKVSFNSILNWLLRTIGVVTSVSTISDLRDLKPGFRKSVTLLGYYEPGDKEPVTYIYKNGTFIDNGGSIIVPNEDTNGAWISEFEGFVDVSHFGCSNSISDNLPFIQKAVNNCDSVFVPSSLDLRINIQGTPVNNETPRNGIQLRSDTNIRLDGKIRLNTTTLNAYDIFGLYNIKNILISGRGEIIGDVDGHSGNFGEHGMGILIYDCDNVRIEGVRVSKCWGDGLILHGAASNVSENLNRNIFVENSIFEDNRRQGVSVLKCDNTKFTNCIFKDTGKTKFALPGCGVDIEPEWFQLAENVTFEKCLFSNNAAMGLFIHSNDHTKNVRNINVFDCVFESKKVSTPGGYFLIGISKAVIDEYSFINNINISNNVFKIYDFDKNVIDISNNVKNVFISKNKFLNNSLSEFENVLTNIMVSQCSNVFIENNYSDVSDYFVDAGGNLCKNINVTGNNITNVFNIGVSIKNGASDIRIKNNYLKDCLKGVLISAGIYDVSITNNNFSDISSYAIYMNYGVNVCLILENIFKNVCSVDDSDLINMNVISIYGDSVDQVKFFIVRNNIFDNSENENNFKYIGRNMSNLNNYQFSDNMFRNDPNPISKIDLIIDPDKMVSVGLSSVSTYGVSKKGIAVADGSSVDTLLASLRDAGIISN